MMPRAKRYRVSFKTFNPGVIVTEHLRRASAVGVTGLGHTFGIPDKVVRELGRASEHEVYLTLIEPYDVNGEAWAKMQVDRLASFGIKAISWESG
jgi:hypothetical protein